MYFCQFVELKLQYVDLNHWVNDPLKSRYWRQDKRLIQQRQRDIGIEGKYQVWSYSTLTSIIKSTIHSCLDIGGWFSKDKKILELILEIQYWNWRQISNVISLIFLLCYKGNERYDIITGTELRCCIYINQPNPIPPIPSHLRWHFQQTKKSSYIYKSKLLSLRCGNMRQFNVKLLITLYLVLLEL